MVSFRLKALLKLFTDHSFEELALPYLNFSISERKIGYLVGISVAELFPGDEMRAERQEALRPLSVTLGNSFRILVVMAFCSKH